MKEKRERKYSDSFYDTARQSFSNVLWMPVIMLGSALLLSVAAVFYAEGKGIDLLDDMVFTTLVSTVPMYVIGIPLGWLVLRKMPKVIRVRHNLRPGQFLKYFPVCMAAVYAGNLIGMLLQELIAAFTGIYPVYEVGELVSNIPYSLVIGLTVLAAPVAEELVFRKFLIDRLQQYGTKLAIVFSGVSFGLFHGNITQCFYAAVLGMVFAYVYTRTGRIIYSILLHMWVNFYSGFVGLWVTDLAGPAAAEGFVFEDLSANPGLMAQVVYSVVTLALVAAGAVIFFREKKHLRFARAGMELERAECFSAAFLNAGAIVLFAYFIYSTITTYMTTGV